MCSLALWPLALENLVHGHEKPLLGRRLCRSRLGRLLLLRWCRWSSLRGMVVIAASCPSSSSSSAAAPDDTAHKRRVHHALAGRGRILGRGDREPVDARRITCRRCSVSAATPEIGGAPDR
jgi:hypothetical protein